MFFQTDFVFSISDRNFFSYFKSKRAEQLTNKTTTKTKNKFNLPFDQRERMY